MFLVAITGGIATGKSTVTDVFRKNGIPIIDADKIAREIVEPGKPAWHQIKEAFGDEVFLPTREIDRDALGKAIFNSSEKRGLLNQITHPRIHRTITMEVFKHLMSGAQYVALDLPLLFETNILMDFIHKIITVTCEPDQQLERLKKRNNFNEEDARKRIATQMPLDTKCEKSHFVIDNSGSIEQTQKEAQQIVQLLNGSRHHWRIRAYIVGAFLAVVCFVLWLNQFFHFLPFDLF
ncbi:dephospho-CoA kinase [Episyrphus balteatus]|uniref:dephospho-CoA kinase n=1 Tax=Episyrphus balteatus TaxID=286459 RepID=UPI002485A146|nr:dephospho-CoA kinase [Episyrphus balteatus]